MIKRCRTEGLSLIFAVVLSISLVGMSGCRALKPGADLHEMDLSGQDLAGKDLSGVNLSGANLQDADLSQANLSKANLAGAELHGTRLTGANLAGATLSASLRSSEFAGAVFENSNLYGLNLSSLDLSNMNFEGARLNKANLSYAVLNGTNLSKAILSGANLSGADLSSADLSGANLSQAILTGADLSGANLSNTNLEEASDFPDNMLAQAVIQRAILGDTVINTLFAKSCNGHPLPGAADLEAVSNEDYVILYTKSYGRYSTMRPTMRIGDIRYVACIDEPGNTLKTCEYNLGDFDIKRIDARVKLVDIRTGEEIATEYFEGEDPEVDHCPATICIGIGSCERGTPAHELVGDGVPPEQINAFIRQSIVTYEAQTLPTVVGHPSWTPYRADTFDSNEGEWFTGEFESEMLSGSKQITSGGYIWDVVSSQPGGHFEPLDTAPLSEFYLSVEVQAINGSQAYAQGLLFVSVDSANFYYFSLNGAGQYGFSLLQNNQWQHLAGPSSSPAIKQGEVNRLAVLSEETRLVLYINDTLVFELNNSELLPAGQVGVAAELTQASDAATLSFDNFQLYTPYANQLISLESARQLAEDGEIEEALIAYEGVVDSDNDFQIPAYYLNTLCWFGSLWGKPAEVIAACDKAVQITSESDPVHLASSRDSRGIARAMTGNFRGAIEDFQAYVERYKDDNLSQDQVEQRENWIAELKKGRNPLDEATLAALRGE